MEDNPEMELNYRSTRYHTSSDKARQFSSRRRAIASNQHSNRQSSGIGEANTRSNLTAFGRRGKPADLQSDFGRSKSGRAESFIERTKNNLHGLTGGRRRLTDVKGRPETVEDKRGDSKSGRIPRGTKGSLIGSKVARHTTTKGLVKVAEASLDAFLMGHLPQRSERSSEKCDKGQQQQQGEDGTERAADLLFSPLDLQGLPPPIQADFSPKEKLRVRGAIKPRLSRCSLDGFENKVNRPPQAEPPQDSYFTFQDDTKLASVERLVSAMTVCDPLQHGNPLVYASSGFMHLSGYSREEIIGRNCRFMQGEETDEEALEQMRQDLSQLKPWLGTLTNYKKDGTKFKVLLYVHPVVDTSNTLYKFIGCHYDVTSGMLEGQPVDDKLLESIATKLKGILDGVFFTLPLVSSNQIRVCTPGYQTLSGYDFTELVSCSWTCNFGPGTGGAILHEIFDALHEVRAARTNLMCYRKDGCPFWGFLYMVPLHAGGSTMDSVQTHLWILADVTYTRTKKIKNYVLGRTLGEGASGVVRVAKAHGSEDLVAVKIVDASKFRSMEEVERIQAEIRILETMKHPNIVNLIEVMFINERFYFVMDYAAGGSMHSLLSKGKLEEEEARRLLMSTLSGLEYCHRRNIVHRDLKSENLLLDQNGEVKIADFGLSVILSPAAQGMSLICGSPAFTAPEVWEATGRGTYGPAVDIWSLGVILYELTTGVLPFSSEKGDGGLKNKICKGTYYIPEHWSSNLTDLMQKMLTVEPSKRIKIEQMWRHPWLGMQDEFMDFHTDSEDTPTVSPTNPKINLNWSPSAAAQNADTLESHHLAVQASDSSHESLREKGNRTSASGVTLDTKTPISSGPFSPSRGSERPPTHSTSPHTRDREPSTSCDVTPVTTKIPSKLSTRSQYDGDGSDASSSKAMTSSPKAGASSPKAGVSSPKLGGSSPKFGGSPFTSLRYEGSSPPTGKGSGGYGERMVISPGAASKNYTNGAVKRVGSFNTLDDAKKSPVAAESKVQSSISEGKRRGSFNDHFSSQGASAVDDFLRTEDRKRDEVARREVLGEALLAGSYSDVKEALIAKRRNEDVSSHSVTSVSDKRDSGQRSSATTPHHAHRRKSTSQSGNPQSSTQGYQDTDVRLPAITACGTGQSNNAGLPPLSAGLNSTVPPARSPHAPDSNSLPALSSPFNNSCTRIDSSKSSNRLNGSRR